MPTIAVFTDNPFQETRARQLAQELALPFADQADYLLILTATSLGLKKTGDKSLPLSINFLSDKMIYRCQHLSLRREALARALGLKGHKQHIPSIVDATAGLARDSFIIAALGFSIQSLERSPLIYALVRDGIERALEQPQMAAIVKRIELIQTDAISWLSQHPADIVYLDPMFPLRKKSALSKLDMRIFHDIIGDDLDADLLLKTALACAKERVVVKRPRLTPFLAGLKPSFSLSGSSSRFDVYCLK